MSWLRSALNKAAEVGGKNIAPNLRTVRNYAGTVYQQAGHAVAGGAKLFQHRLSGKKLTSLKTAVKRLDEVSLNVRGAERVLALERWLCALKDIDDSFRKSFSKTNVDDGAEALPFPDKFDDREKDTSPKKASAVIFFDKDAGGQSANFRDVFLRSHALENIVTSLILEEPQDEEIAMLREIFRYCLAGGQELHIALISSIQDLARAFSTQMDEIMVKKSQLLELVCDAITGLKLSSEAERLDAEILSLQNEISARNGQLENKAGWETPASIPYTGQEGSLSHEGLEITQDISKLGMELRTCLTKKQSFLHIGDTSTSRAEKVARLKEISTTLSDSITQKKKEIVDNKLQQEKALQYRQTKVQETLELEKAVAAEVRTLEKRRGELEAELKEVKAALASATARHINIQEEKEQFDDASSNIVGHLSLQEQELSRSITVSSAEANVVGTWVSFLEDTWLLQSSYLQEKDKDMKRTFQEGRHQLINAASKNMFFHEERLRGLLQHLRSIIDELKTINDTRNRAEDSKSEHTASSPDKHTAQLLANYQEAERQIVNTFSTLLRLKEEVHSFEQETDESEPDLFKHATKSFAAIDDLRKEFETLERPAALLSVPVVPPESANTQSSLETVSSEGDQTADNLPVHSNQPKEPASISGTRLDDANLHKNSEATQSDSGLETEGWELDELEQALNTASLG